jgi:hypothetical protein
MKKLLFSVTTALCMGYGAVKAQTLTINNMSCYDVHVYGGYVNVGGVDYGFGDQTYSYDPCTIVAAGATGYFDTNPGTCTGYTGSITGTSTNTNFLIFKMEMMQGGSVVAAGAHYSGAAYLSVSLSVPTPCPNPTCTAVWTGGSTNPTVWILP